ncbi:MAG: glycosyl hydrolase, partial [Verrucomicrobiales bacterium]
MAAQPSFASPSKPSTKKGWAGGNRAYHETFGVSWYYNWTPNRSSSPAEFVPMIKGKWNVNDKTFQKIKGYPEICALLGYNEPERKKQGNLPLDHAIKLWPKVMQLAQEKGIRLGSPAPSSDHEGIQYLEKFMDEVEKRDLHVDFIAAHWYGGRDIDAFERFIERLDKRYDRPIWLTEFNGWSGPEDENYKFLKDALKFLEKE